MNAPAARVHGHRLDQVVQQGPPLLEGELPQARRDLRHLRLDGADAGRAIHLGLAGQQEQVPALSERRALGVELGGE